jgi:hypothetical protein
MCTETCPFATALFPNFGHSVLSCIKKVRKTNYTMVNYTEMSVLSSEMEHPGAIFALVGGVPKWPSQNCSETPRVHQSISCHGIELARLTNFTNMLEIH